MMLNDGQKNVAAEHYDVQIKTACIHRDNWWNCVTSGKMCISITLFGEQSATTSYCSYEKVLCVHQNKGNEAQWKLCQAKLVNYALSFESEKPSRKWATAHIQHQPSTTTFATRKIKVWWPTCFCGEWVFSEFYDISPGREWPEKLYDDYAVELPAWLMSVEKPSEHRVGQRGNILIFIEYLCSKCLSLLWIHPPLSEL